MSDTTYDALEKAIIDHMAVLEPGSIVTEWFLPIVVMSPDMQHGAAQHWHVSSGLSLHSRVGILTYHLRASEHLMIHPEEATE